MCIRDSRMTIQNPNGAGYRIPMSRAGSIRQEWQQEQPVIYGPIADRLGKYEDLGTIQELAEMKRQFLEKK